MVAQLLTNHQQENMTRQQKRDRERRYLKTQKRLQKLAAKTNLPVTFDNTSVTAYGNFGLFESLKQAIGLTDMLKKQFKVKRHHNCIYSGAGSFAVLPYGRSKT